MSIKGAAEAVLPPPAQGWLKQVIYHRNCHLSPPQYRAALKHWYWLFKGRPCHLEAPRTMTEKIHWLKLYDSTPLKGRLADKFLVREWVADTVGEEYLVPLLGVWDSPDEIDFASLPTSFVLKATHGSGWNILVPNKSALDEEWARGRLREWLGLRQAMKGGFELHYEYCEPRIVCERFLRDGTGGLRDYKFMVFDGVVQFAFTVDRRAGLAMRGTYLPDWTRAPFEYTCEAVRAPDVPPPSGLETMLRLASRLGKGFACARVDFYQVRGRVYFGEITFTDADGLSEFAPARYNRIFGNRIVLPEKKSFKGIIL
jgi:glycosyltransferase